MDKAKKVSEEDRLKLALQGERKLRIDAEANNLELMSKEIQRAKAQFMFEAQALRLTLVEKYGLSDGDAVTDTGDIIQAKRPAVSVVPAPEQAAG